ncbi:hypothetical protein J7337_011058 [Fusarium musae]|uniref:Uncharacterized protein n=1 Tax=Fusarium musae TaxID=1042133 RepID=A0A9P8DA82_9HYPO|nr:hypothetical protein J7337_011058 [Fusarium musae]KAG9498163.1 hypothetical protein J7337_011058 [Fusarium musae]
MRPRSLVKPKVAPLLDTQPPASWDPEIDVKDTEADIERFNNDPEYYKTFRKQIEQQMNEKFAASIKNLEAHEKGRQPIVTDSGLQ